MNDGLENDMEEEMGAQSGFSGFPPEMLNFLFELRLTNTPANQAENLRRYKALLSEPLMRLYDALLGTVQALCLPVETKPARCVSTPYTDRRFSPGTPLKEYVYLRFRQSGRETDIPGLFFDMGMEYRGCGLQIYRQTTRGMELLRERIRNDPWKYSGILERLYSAGFEVVGERYKKDHAPELPDCAAKELINCRGFCVERRAPVGETVFSSALAAELSSAFEQLSGFFRELEDWA